MKLAPIALCLLFVIIFAVIASVQLLGGEVFQALISAGACALFAATILLSCWQYRLQATADEEAMEIELHRLRTDRDNLLRRGGRQ